VIEVIELTREQFDSEVAGLDTIIPIEQTSAWLDYEATIPGRTPWGYVALRREGHTLAVACFADYETHGYHFLRGHHAPVWADEPSEADEAEALEALSSYVRAKDRKQVFVRLSVMHDLPACRPTLSTLPYDQTVVIDVTGGDDEILARMKPRGRRDVRKALRESKVECADETERAGESFAEYYEVMRETGERDGFTPAPISDYEDMLRILGPERCRVFAGRLDGRVVTWSIVTISKTRAVRYYGASLNETMRQHVTDKLVYFECCELGRLGCLDYDMMAIGSDFQPKLLGLNEFKTKFAKQVTPVAPDRDLPLRKTFYASLVKLRSQVQKRREKAAAQDEAGSAGTPREDLVPVILGGDIGVYALGREFNEAYHTTCVCVASAPIGAIEHSSIFEVKPVSALDADEVARAVREVAEANADRHVVVVANTDALIDVLGQVRGDFPANVSCPIPSPEVIARVSDKVEFARLCEGHGLETPRTEVVRLAGSDPIGATSIAFPLVAKPAVSSAYAALLNAGFKKVYYVREQSELDALWRELREAGFAGDFLVQELISGDDTFMDSITIYMNSKGEAEMFGSAQVLLEDHAPTMLGNPVVMVTRPMPELWEKAAALLADVGYRGFANFDVKRDPKTGRALFLEVNPRIGRNSYYNAAAGVNPMRAMVSDVVDGKPTRNLKADEKILYTLVPTSLIPTYVTDPALLAEVNELISAGKVFDPQRYEPDMGLRRRMDVDLTEQNQVRKFKAYYPKPTETSF
jgi:D-aspartate ligase